MKRYKYIIDKNKEDKGVFAISLVEMPAIQSNWVALSAEKRVVMKELDRKKGILMGAVLIPDKPFLRVDKKTGEEFEAMFTKEVIEQSAYNFAREGSLTNSTKEHLSDLKGKAYVVESWIKENENDKSVELGINEPVGTWFVKMKIEDKKLYQEALDGKINGFSIEGIFSKELVNSKSVNMSKTKKPSFAERLVKMFSEVLEDEKETTELASIAIKDSENSISFEGDELEVGKVVTVGEEPAPEGTHTLENDTVITVTRNEQGQSIVEEINQVELESDEDEEMKEKEETEMAEKLSSVFKKKFDQIEKSQSEKVTKLSQTIEKQNETITKLSEQVEKLSKEPADGFGSGKKRNVELSDENLDPRVRSYQEFKKNRDA